MTEPASSNNSGAGYSLIGIPLFCQKMKIVERRQGVQELVPDEPGENLVYQTGKKNAY